MNLNKSSKITIGVLTFLPLIVGVVTVIIAVYQIFSFIFSQDPAMPIMLLSYLGYIIPYIFFFFLIYLALGIFYLVHIIQNKSLDDEKKFLWVVVLIILNGISMPVYWYVHIWKGVPSKNFESDSIFDNTYESGTESQKL